MNCKYTYVEQLLLQYYSTVFGIYNVKIALGLRSNPNNINLLCLERFYLKYYQVYGWVYMKKNKML